ncbi:GNAT family N-acetyltransferase [Rathayibacter tanaceti]|uniref:N-acetyltransferase n=2 Tax=Rathayibacter tanaceti TaxID=1671680 RepID=A0A168GBT1_9MICO|nr:GNAT family N-acetyltransferase [Rathayibacter tanaceti]KZX22826.1 hypothetical protein ACH61_00046 [Rathayibacter tanaceti]QHC55507.1 N-acetyltransferase [Rathayibacter tanaceti]TCO39718.1 hypothetical protein EV639_101674 [Rathayibacter tanaceti]
MSRWRAGAVARIEVDGVLAARGQVGVSGSDAVLDRIETGAEFRRRGLGGLVVGALTSWAGGEGARTGLLLASADGHALYRSLGWAVAAPASTWRGSDGVEV